MFEIERLVGNKKESLITNSYRLALKALRLSKNPYTYIRKYIQGYTFVGNTDKIVEIPKEINYILDTLTFTVDGKRLYKEEAYKHKRALYIKNNDLQKYENLLQRKSNRFSK